MFHHFFHQNNGTSNPTLKLFDGQLNGVNNLNASLTINGVTVNPMLRYKGGDATSTTWPAWGYGPNLNIFGTYGTHLDPTLNQGSPLVGASDDSVLFNNGKCYQAPDSTTGQIDTEDFAIEYVFKFGAATLRHLGTQADSDNRGWAIYPLISSNELIVRLSGVNTQLDFGASATFFAGNWYHVMIFGNSDENSTNGVRICVNGIVNATNGASSPNMSTCGSLNTTHKFTLGGYTLDSNQAYDSNISYFAAWKQANWHQQGAAGPAEWATIAATRFAQLTGTYPAKAAGTVLPTTQTRSTAAYVDKVAGSVRTLYLVGANWPRMCQRKDTANNVVVGYLNEVGVTNLFKHSQNFVSSGAWNFAPDTSSLDCTAAPDGTLTADGFIPAAGVGGAHPLYQSPTLTVAPYTFSIFAKIGVSTVAPWIYLSDNTVGSGAFFNIVTGVLGQVNVGVSASIENWGNGWFRCIKTWTGTAAAHVLAIYQSNVNGLVTFDSDGSLTHYFWGAQVELGSTATSYIPTTTAAAARSADALVYKLNDGNLADGTGQALSCKLLLPAYTTPAAGLTPLDAGGLRFDLTETTATLDNTSDLSSAYSKDLTDGASHRLWGIATTNRGQIMMDGYMGALDSSVTPVTNNASLYVGNTTGSAQYLNGLISDVKLYRRATKK